MEKVTNEQLGQKIDELARITAAGFASADEKFATKQELATEIAAVRKDMKNGFGLIMEELKPMRQSYQALKDDLAPQVLDHTTRISKLEQKIA